MERKEFLSNLGFTVAACACGALVSCSKSSDNPGGGGNVDTPIEIDLATSLLTVGSSVTRSGIIIVRLADTNVATSFTAVDVACTHQGTSVFFSTASNTFVCPNHGSEFSTNGSVLQGPASRGLAKYDIVITGNTLAVN